MALIRDKALAGSLTSLMEQVAQQEQVRPETIQEGLASGNIVILHNTGRDNGIPLAIGEGLRTKVSASIGMHGHQDMERELHKIQAAVQAGTDAIMDLSVSGNIEAMRKASLAATNKPVGTLPLYQAMATANERYGSSLQMTVEDLFTIIEKQATDGVDFLALHCGITMDVIERAKQEERIDPLVSYGGTHLIGWMLYHQKENPLYHHFDRILEIAAQYDVTLSLADAMRPGCLADSLDAAQVQELVVLGSLVRRARKAGVQIMVKGPGHVPLDQLKATVALEKSLCQGAPYFVFGPLVTDTAVGYDHISAAIGGAISAWAGAEFLCYVTPAEHIGLPNVQQVHEGVVAARIAAHCADLAKQRPEAVQWDLDMSVARKQLNWEKQIALSVDPLTTEKIWKDRSGEFSSKCTMCGKYCAMEIISKYLGTDKIQAC